MKMLNIHVFENENYFAWKSLNLNNIGDLNVFNIEIIYSNGFRLIFQHPDFFFPPLTCALVEFSTKRENHVFLV
jgi:hypothetical protein